MLGRCCCGPPLTAASCSAAHKARDQRHNQALRQPACPCKATATRGDSGAPTGQRGTQGGTHAGAEVASQKLETGPSPM